MTDARDDRKLPVTGELGSEGGSHGDPTHQVAELEGDIGRTSGAAEPDTADSRTGDAVKYPTE